MTLSATLPIMACGGGGANFVDSYFVQLYMFAARLATAQQKRSIRRETACHYGGIYRAIPSGLQQPASPTTALYTSNM
jgi:hypothetical protein